MEITPVILCGGNGSRLWPQSRSAYPKQFLPLINDHSMLQNTIERLENLSGVCSPLIIANESHRFLVAEQVRQTGLKASGILLEPVGRNTAPALALAALEATQSGKDPVLLVLAADHNIRDVPAFHQAIDSAMSSAISGKLVTFGIEPSHPETGYGYIKAASSEASAQDVEKFVEKPDLKTAESYLAEGGYYWNSGMFLFKASRYLEELKSFRPEMYDICLQSFKQRSTDMDFIRIDEEVFSTCPDDSIDYAVMEKTQDAVVVPMNIGWSDVGSWSSLWEVSDKDGAGNVTRGDVLALESQNCLVRSEHKLVACIGLEDMLVIESDDAIFVAPRDKSQEVKKVVNQLKAEGRPEYDIHRKVYRPWGCYDSIDEGERFQVKRITVKPGSTLSLQKHYHRAEHWVVVRGTALVTCGEKEFLISENESTYIPVGEVHRLENPGKVPLELIEIQSGTYLGEDDIVRFEDDYGRV